ncbi:ubiquitin-specific protease doa4 [Rhizopus stolonifer]|uniref:ubiquitinyl hydrolase 1 n=1 Tax=Rhizopus stolonifer TaxID=4846 RepID=A0A367J7B5_RHIST|nr:ubiquitin-specific protease doa4 [Rhizopus stolonifer]
MRPAPPAQAKLQRRRTFIDNPFNGFTTTTSKLYDVPPVPTVATSGTKKVQQKPPSMEPADAIIKFAPRFSGTDQHDSQEFLTFLLDGIHEDVNLARKPMQEIEYDNLPDWQASAMSWERYLTRHTSIVVSLFQGQYQSRLICSSCKHTSTTYTPFMSLSLPIPAKRLKITNVTLYQCLDFFVKEEILEKEDAWFCPQCKKKRKATKQLTLSRLPDVLLIHLKRFSADGLFKNKLDTMVKYPTRGFDLYGYVSKFIPPKQSSAQDRASSTYDLYAVSVRNF